MQKIAFGNSDLPVRLAVFIGEARQVVEVRIACVDGKGILVQSFRPGRERFEIPPAAF